MNKDYNKFALRAVEPSDANWMFHVENDPEAIAYGDWTAPLSLDAILQYAKTYEADPIKAGQLRLMGCLRNTPDVTLAIVDLIKIDIFNSRAYVGIYVAKEFRKQGIARHFLTMIAEYAKYHLGLNQLVANITADNEVSRHLFEKAGYKKVGTLPKWYRKGQEFVDVYRYSLPLK